MSLCSNPTVYRMEQHGWHSTSNIFSAKRCFFFDRTDITERISHRTRGQRNRGSPHPYFAAQIKNTLPSARVRFFFPRAGAIMSARILNASRTGRMQLPTQRWFRVHVGEEDFLHVEFSRWTTCRRGSAYLSWEYNNRAAPFVAFHLKALFTWRGQTTEEHLRYFQEV